MDKSILQKATNPSNEDLSGWMYSLIAKMTQKSPEEAQNVSQYLLKRLKQANVNTKRKTLQVIAYLAEHGAPCFVDETIKYEASLREMSDFRGPKDPLHGDSLNQQIRSAAQKAIQQLYASAEKRQNTMRQHEALEKDAFDVNKNQQGYFSRWTSSPQDNTPQNVTQSSMFQGVSSGEYSTHLESGGAPVGGMMGGMMGHTGSLPNTSLSAGASNDPRFQGFGNPDFNSNMGSMGSGSPSSAQESETWKDWGLKKLTTWKKTNNKPYAVNPDDYPNFLNQETKAYVPPEAPNGGYSSFDLGTSGTSNSGGKSTFVPPVKKLATGSAEWGLSHSTRDDDSTALDADDSADEGYESRLVEEVCSSNGVRVQPTRQELRQFTQKCANLNGSRLAAHLDERLSNHHKWQCRLKALCAIEALLQSQNKAVEQYFERNFDNVGRQTEAVQSSVSKKASSILSMLSPEVADEPAEGSLFGSKGVTTKTTASSNNRSNGTSLLDFEDESQNGAPQQHQPPATHQNSTSSQNEASSLFSNLNLKNTPTKQASSTSTSSLMADDIFADTEQILDDQNREQLTRDRSNSKRSILDTLEHFMTPTSPNTSTNSSTSSSTTASTGFAPRITATTTTPHTVPILPTNSPLYPQHATAFVPVYVPAGPGGVPHVMHHGVIPQYAQPRAGVAGGKFSAGMPVNVHARRSPQQQQNDAFDFLNKKNSAESNDKHFGFVNDLLRKGDSSQKKDDSKPAPSSFSFIK